MYIVSKQVHEVLQGIPGHDEFKIKAHDEMKRLEAGLLATRLMDETSPEWQAHRKLVEEQIPTMLNHPQKPVHVEPKFKAHQTHTKSQAQGMPKTQGKSHAPGKTQTNPQVQGTPRTQRKSQTLGTSPKYDFDKTENLQQVAKDRTSTTRRKKP
jgi:hypothetical protein